ncbi:hypothetical protein QZH41_016139, partial [Actinostola sp. cb2023]
MGYTNKRLCKKCNKPHPTALHIDNFKVKGQENNGTNDNKQVASTSVSSACTDVDKDSRCARKTNNNVILHVKVKIKNGTDTVTTYDNGSPGCFITEGLKEQLAVEGIKTTLQLGTMHGQISVESSIVEQATSQDCNASSHRIAVQELESIKEVITPQSVVTMFELDSVNDHSSTSDDSSLSQEDKEFLSIADQGTRRVDGHYNESPLPFRDPNVVMPNNREQAEKRADWQRKKMLRDDEYHRDYTNFINSRPLAFISNDIDDLERLTPSHLLTTKSAVVVPPPGNLQK